MVLNMTLHQSYHHLSFECFLTSVVITVEKNPSILLDIDNLTNKQENIDFYLGEAGSVGYTKDKKLSSIKVTKLIGIF